MRFLLYKKREKLVIESTLIKIFFPPLRYKTPCHVVRHWSIFQLHMHVWNFWVYNVHIFKFENHFDLYFSWQIIYWEWRIFFPIFLSFRSSIFEKLLLMRKWQKCWAFLLVIFYTKWLMDRFSAKCVPYEVFEKESGLTNR